MASQDVGLQVVDRIYESLMVEAQWSLRGPRGFTWWSYTDWPNTSRPACRFSWVTSAATPTATASEE